MHVDPVGNAGLGEERHFAGAGADARGVVILDQVAAAQIRFHGQVCLCHGEQRVEVTAERIDGDDTARGRRPDPPGGGPAVVLGVRDALGVGDGIVIDVVGVAAGEARVGGVAHVRARGRHDAAGKRDRVFVEVVVVVRGFHIVDPDLAGAVGRVDRGTAGGAQSATLKIRYGTPSFLPSSRMGTLKVAVVWPWAKLRVPDVAV